MHIHFYIFKYGMMFWILDQIYQFPDTSNNHAQAFFSIRGM